MSSMTLAERTRPFRRWLARRVYPELRELEYAASELPRQRERVEWYRRTIKQAARALEGQGP